MMPMNPVPSPPKENGRSLDEIERDIIDLLAEHMTLKGVSARTARVYAYMYLRVGLTQREFQAVTGYSAGTISSSLATMERYGVVVKTRDRATRQFKYSLSGTLVEIGASLLQQSLESINRRVDFFKRIAKRLEDPELAGKKGYDSVHAFVEQVCRSLPAYEAAGRALIEILTKQERGGL